MSSDQKLKEIRNAIISLSIPKTREATKNALESGVDPYQIINQGLAAGLLEIGDKWTKKEVFISHILVAAKAMTTGQDLVEKKLGGTGREDKYKATIILGTPKGDLHDIGKNLVSLMMKAGGFKVYDLGVDVAPQTFIEKARKVDADLIGMSLIMSICLDQMEKVCTLVKESGLKTKTIIGGPPTSEKVAREIGADAYGGFDAPTGVKIAKRMLGRV